MIHCRTCIISYQACLFTYLFTTKWMDIHVKNFCFIILMGYLRIIASFVCPHIQQAVSYSHVQRVCNVTIHFVTINILFNILTGGPLQAYGPKRHEAGVRFAFERAIESEFPVVRLYWAFSESLTCELRLLSQHLPAVIGAYALAQLLPMNKHRLPNIVDLFYTIQCYQMAFRYIPRD